MESTDFGALNSATKYPSIYTYHTLDPKDGSLLDEVTRFTGPVMLTEKVDGTNGRIVVMPDGDWFIGSREELLYARGDRIESPALGIVAALKPVAERLLGREKSGLGAPGIDVYFLEVYGHRIGPGAKQYSKTPGMTGCRMFDIAWVPMTVLDMERTAIAGWRDRGGQRWAEENVLQYAALETGVELTPRLGIVNGEDLPASLEDTLSFLQQQLPQTQAALDPSGLGAPEGIVLRTPDRSMIAKAKSEDYVRTLKRRQKG